MKAAVLTMLAAGILAGLAAPAPAAAPKTASVTIRHQVRGCHSWSVNGGPFAASHTFALGRGGSIRFTNDDVMPHALIEVSGPRVQMRDGDTMPMAGWMHRAGAPGVMNHMGATTTVSLSRAGTYVFTTRAGEDYMVGFRTVGADSVLRLTVKVR